MDTKYITVQIRRPKSREQLRRERRDKVIAIIGMVTGVGAILAAAALALLLLGQIAKAVALEPPEEPVEPPVAVVTPSPAPTPTPAPVATPEPTPEPPAYSAEELELLALVIYQEAGADKCSDETRRMVGEVVLNRVADPRFPDTLAEVLTQKRQYGRLYWTGLVWPQRAETDYEAHAVARAYAIAEIVLTSDRLLPEDVIFQAEFPQGSEIVAQAPGFYFCR